MSNNNDNFGKSDKWGRPFGFKKVHIIDSSVLPSIPATTITLTVMANAARIANNHKKY
jgi:choline dehydrogenase-like flavoprotein